MNAPRIPYFDLRKVNDVRSRLAAGSYSAPSERVAEALLVEHLLFALLFEPRAEKTVAREHADR